jgi:hypothetical protein
MTTFLLIVILVWADGGSVKTVVGPYADRAACEAIRAEVQGVVDAELTGAEDPVMKTRAEDPQGPAGPEPEHGGAFQRQDAGGVAGHPGRAGAGVSGPGAAARAEADGAGAAGGAGPHRAQRPHRGSADAAVAAVAAEATVNEPDPVYGIQARPITEEILARGVAIAEAHDTRETQLDRIERKVDDLSRALLEMAKSMITRGAL